MIPAGAPLWPANSGRAIPIAIPTHSLVEWVCKTKAWWSDVLDLVAPDLAYVHMLINDLKAGKEIEVSL